MAWAWLVHTPQVGPPPGGPAYVLLYIPVVFFTARGIPGEVDERLDTPEGIMSASMRSMGASMREAAAAAAAAGAPAAPAPPDSDEAEYAWLPLDCIKPFQLGDISGVAGGAASPDAALQLSVAAAETALRAGQVAAGGVILETNDVESDSDGGWGIPARPPSNTTLRTSSVRGGRGRGRGGRRGKGRGGRGRGGRGGRGRGGAYSLGDEDFSDGETAVDTVSPPEPLPPPNAPYKPVVESILAWRLPLSEKEKEAERWVCKHACP